MRFNDFKEENRDFKDREAQRKYIERLKADPVKWAEYQERRREQNRLYRERHKHDQEWHDRQNAASAKYYRKIADSKAFQEKQSKRNSQKWAQIVSDPSLHQRKLEQGRSDYAAHREERLAKQKIYNEAHKEEKAARDKAYREAHKEEIAAKKKAYYSTEHGQNLKKAEYRRHAADYIRRAKNQYNDADKREYIKERVKKRRDENYERVHARELEYSRSHAQENAARAKKWREENPQKVQVLRKFHEAVRRESGTLTKAEVDLIYAENEQRNGVLSCEYCGKTLDPSVKNTVHLDHFYPLNPRNPLVPKGTTSYVNSRLVCCECNKSKIDKDPYVWLRSEGYEDGGAYRGTT